MQLFAYLKGKTIYKYFPLLDEKPGAPLGAVNPDMQQNTKGAP